LRVLYLSFALIVIDQVTKFLVKGLKIGWLGLNVQGMPYGSSKQVLGNFVRITFIENPGMAFGVDFIPRILLIIFNIAACVLILYFIYKYRNNNFLICLSLAFILAGALGNIIDRTFYGLIYSYAPVFYGRVVDFIQVEFWDFTFLGKTYTTWPILNIADVSVTIGFFILLVFHKRVFRQFDENLTLASSASGTQNLEEHDFKEKSGHLTGDINNISYIGN
jgi:signal peptidase II